MATRTFQIIDLISDDVEKQFCITIYGKDIHHKNIAYEMGATNKGIYSIMDKLIKTGSRIAITISEKI